LLRVISDQPFINDQRLHRVRPTAVHQWPARTNHV